MITPTDSHIEEEKRDGVENRNQSDVAPVRDSNMRTIVKTNTPEKSHKCDLCDYESAYKSVLRRHTKAHFGEKSFKCNQCDFAAVQAVNLRTHLKTHSGDRPHKCNQCDTYENSFWGETI